MAGGALLLLVLIFFERHKRQHRRLARSPGYSNRSALRERLANVREGHNPRLCQEWFGMSEACFAAITQYLELRPESYRGIRVISGEEQLALFLDWAREAHSFRGCAKSTRVAPETARRYVRKVAERLCRNALETMTWPKPHELFGDTPKYQPFRGAVGAIDGCHCPVHESILGGDVLQRESWRNRKGFLSTNVLAVSTLGHTLRFLSIFPGAEGRANDARLFATIRRELREKIPNGGYLLGDAGFPLVRNFILTPYRGVRYHLKEWAASAEHRPSTPEELFNLRHAQLRNAVERIFGVWKRRFKVLSSPPEWRNIDDAMNVLRALAALHNLIRHCDSNTDEERLLTDDVIGDHPRDASRGDGGGRGGGGDRGDDEMHVEEEEEEEEEPTEEVLGDAAERAAAVQWRDGIRDALWRAYVAELRRRNLDVAPHEVDPDAIAAALHTRR